MANLNNLPVGETEVAGRLHKIIFEAPDGYSIGIFLIYDKDVISAVGKKFVTVKGTNLPKMHGITHKFHGNWVISSKEVYFNCRYTEISDDNTKQTVIRMLESEYFPTVSQELSKKLAEKFDKQIWKIIEDEPEKLCQVGISKNDALTIQESYYASRSVTSLSRFLNKFGVMGNVVMKINDVYGADAIQLIKKNPYCMLSNVKGVGFETCDKIARGLYEAGENQNILACDERITSAIRSTLLRECEMTGAMYVEGNQLYKDSIARLNNGINGAAPVNLQRWTEVYQKMIKRGTLVDRKFKNNEKTIHLIFLSSYDLAERTIAYQFLGMRKRSTGIKEDVAKAKVKEYSDAQKFHLSELQQAACVRSLMSGVSMIVGGPGTGKTTILRCLISCYKKLTGKEVTCMAPTGKAARRMSESTQLPATTIHSRLGIVSGDVTKAKVNKIEEGLIIIDEVSMVDTLLMSKVAEAIGEHCHLVMVGDVDQLPSVGPGAVLLQLIKSDCIPYSRLLEVFRQKDGGVIVDNARNINEGVTELEYNNDFQFVEANSEEEAVKKIQQIFKEEVETWGIDNVALLSPLRRNREGKHPCSSDGINPLLQQMFNPSREDEPFVRSNGIEYKKNDRVMKWANGEKSSNGDIGVVQCVTVEDGVSALEISWDNGNTEIIKKQDLDEITLAYSMSIHKSQGSEYNSVIIPVLWSQKCPLFRRSLLYTGVTRAKKKVILVGDKKSVAYMSTHADGTQRNTLLSRRLQYNDKKYISGISEKK